MYTFLKLTTFEKIFFKNTTVRSKRIRNASLYIFFKYSFICPCAFMFLLVLWLLKWLVIDPSMFRGLWLWVVLVRVGLAIQFGRTGFLQLCFHTVYPIYILAVLHDMIYNMYIIICINIFVENSSDFLVFLFYFFSMSVIYAYTICCC